MSEQSQSLDPRIARTRLAVQMSVVKLLSSEHPFKSLTISEVAEAAGITRKTFYARFGTLEQVVMDMAFEMFDSTAYSVTDDMLVLPLSNSVLTSVVFRTYEQHKEILEPLLMYCPGSLFMEPCERAIGLLLDRTLSVNQLLPLKGFERDYLIAIFASTLHATLTLWVKRGFKDSTDQLAILIDKLLGPGVDKLLKNVE